MRTGRELIDLLFYGDVDPKMTPKYGMSIEGGVEKTVPAERYTKNYTLADEKMNPVTITEKHSKGGVIRSRSDIPNKPLTLTREIPVEGRFEKKQEEPTPAPQPEPKIQDIFSGAALPPRREPAGMDAAAIGALAGAAVPELVSAIKGYQPAGEAGKIGFAKVVDRVIPKKSELMIKDEDGIPVYEESRNMVGEKVWVKPVGTKGGKNGGSDIFSPRFVDYRGPDGKPVTVRLITNKQTGDTETTIQTPSGTWNKVSLSALTPYEQWQLKEVTDAEGNIVRHVYDPTSGGYVGGSASGVAAQGEAAKYGTTSKVLESQKQEIGALKKKQTTAEEQVKLAGTVFDHFNDEAISTQPARFAIGVKMLASALESGKLSDKDVEIVEGKTGMSLEDLIGLNVDTMVDGDRERLRVQLLDAMDLVTDRAISMWPEFGSINKKLEQDLGLSPPPKIKRTRKKIQIEKPIYTEAVKKTAEKSSYKQKEQTRREIDEFERLEKKYSK